MDSPEVGQRDRRRWRYVVPLFGMGALLIVGAWWWGSRSGTSVPTPLRGRAPVEELAKASELDPTVEARAYSGNRTKITDGLTTFRETPVVTREDSGRRLDRLEFECHGGRAKIMWHIGNLEPRKPATGIHLTVRLDDERIASLLKGSTRGIWNDAPAEIHEVVDCPAGRHVLELAIESVHGAWGFPYVVNPGEPPSEHLRVNRGFIVEEVWTEP